MTVVSWRRPEPVRLNLGCHRNPMPGYLNVDIESYPGVDQVANLEKTWPWPDHSVDEIYCKDFPEHLRQCWEEPDPERLANAQSLLAECVDDRLVGEVARAACVELLAAIEKPKRHYGVLHFMAEANRVLRPGGLLECVIPSSDGRGAFQDPTHVSFWNQNTLAYFLGNCEESKLYGQGDNWKLISRHTSAPNEHGVTYLHFIMEKM